MKLPPLEVMAQWPTPNYIDPPTHGHGVLIVNLVCITMALLVVMLRLYTRFRITCSAGIDDLLIVIGLIFAIAMAVVTLLATERWAWNRHIWDVPIFIFFCVILDSLCLIRTDLVGRFGQKFCIYCRGRL